MVDADIQAPGSELPAGKVAEADIVIGIPSYNNSRTIGHVVRAVSAGLAKHFPEHRSVIINSDGGSKDGTPQAVLEAEHEGDKLMLVRHPMYPVHKITTPYNGLPGKGSAFRTIFETADRLKAKACAVVDSDLRSITPDWVDLLVRPVLQSNFDYVAPYYRRHKYDGTITNSIVYPLTRALYGKQVRQPIGGEFGLSPKMWQRLLAKKEDWETDVARFGIDIWMTTTALAEGFTVCQVFLGAKIHDAKDPGADLSAMLVQVLGALFGLMEEYEKNWREVQGSAPTPLFGFPYAVGLEPIKVNPQKMVGNFQQACKDLLGVYESFLRADMVAELKHLAELPPDKFHFPDETWVTLVFDFALAFHRRTIDRQHLLQSLTPLYIGRVASFVLDTLELDDHAAEEKIEGLCLMYEQMKPYLTQRWAGK